MKTKRRSVFAALAAFVAAPFARGGGKEGPEKQALLDGPPPFDGRVLLHASSHYVAKDFKIDPDAPHDCGASNGLMAAIGEELTASLGKFDLDGVRIDVRWVSILDRQHNPEGKFGYFRVYVTKWGHPTAENPSMVPSLEFSERMPYV